MAEAVPATRVRSTGPGVETAGVLKVSAVPVWLTVNSPTPRVTAPMRTERTVSRRVPVTVTAVPPVVGPLSGVMVAMVGGSAVMVTVPAT